MVWKQEVFIRFLFLFRFPNKSKDCLNKFCSTLSSLNFENIQRKPVNSESIQREAVWTIFTFRIVWVILLYFYLSWKGLNSLQNKIYNLPSDSSALLYICVSSHTLRPGQNSWWFFWTLINQSRPHTRILKQFLANLLNDNLLTFHYRCSQFHVCKL